MAFSKFNLSSNVVRGMLEVTKILIEPGHDNTLSVEV